MAATPPLPILFIHGFPLTSAMWADAAAAVPPATYALTPDLPGHGSSPHDPHCSIASFADTLAILLQAQPRPAAIVGLSMGGIIAFELFRRYRPLLGALVLCDTRATAETPDGKTAREQLARAVLARGSVTAADAMIPKLFAPATPPAVRDRWHAVITQQDPRSVAATALALAARPDSLPTLPTIDLPTLVLCGEHDSITPPDQMSQLAAAIGTHPLAGPPEPAEFVMIPDAGHLPPIEQPRAFSRALNAFLTRRFLASVPRDPD